MEQGTGNRETARFDWLRKNIFAAVLFAFFSSALLTTATAQIQFPVGLPTLKVGDIAKYRTIDLWNNNQLSTSSLELLGVQNDRLVTKFISSTAAEPTTVSFTLEWQPCRAMSNSDQLICAGGLKFPMQVGTKSSYEKQPWSNRNGYDSATCEVKGEEKVSVAAGAFDTLRIECTGFWNRVIDDQPGSNRGRSGRITTAFWYAPAIGRWVKSQYSNFNSFSPNPFTKNQTELVEFVAGK